MSDELIKIDVDKEHVVELADFIENELKPPSRTRWLILYFALGLAGGVGLGMFISWLR